MARPTQGSYGDTSLSCAFGCCLKGSVSDDGTQTIATVYGQKCRAGPAMASCCGGVDEPGADPGDERRKAQETVRRMATELTEN